MSAAEYRWVSKYLAKFYDLPSKSMSHRVPRWTTAVICLLDRVSESCTGSQSPGQGLRVLDRVSESWTGSQSPGQGLRVLL